MSEGKPPVLSAATLMAADVQWQSAPPEPMDLLNDPAVRSVFEETSAALEAASLVRRMRRQALSASGVRGISQWELAQRTGLTQPRISQLEKGEGRDGISYAVLRKIAHACGTDFGRLVREGIDREAAPVPAEHFIYGNVDSAGMTSTAYARSDDTFQEHVVSAGSEVTGQNLEAMQRQPTAGGPTALDDDEARLMERIRARDIGAFEELYRSYYHRLSRFLLKRIQRPHLVAEVLNDTLLVVWSRPDAFNGDSKLSTWIFAIAYRKAMKALRSHQDPIEDDDAEQNAGVHDEGTRAPTAVRLFGSIKVPGISGTAIPVSSPKVQEER